MRRRLILTFASAVMLAMSCPGAAQAGADAAISPPGLDAVASGIEPEFQTQIQSLTTEAGRRVTYRPVVTGSSPLTWQWQRRVSEANGFDNVPGATNSSLTTDHLVYPKDNGTQYRLVVSNQFGLVIGSVSTITVTADTNGPVVALANGTVDLNKITVTFNEPLEPMSAADTFNYMMNQGEFGIMTAVLDPDEVTVRLTLSGPLAPDTDYIFSVFNVRDYTGNILREDPTTFSFRSYAPSQGFVIFEAYNTGGGTAVADLVGSPLYPDSPDTQAYLGGFDSRLIYPKDAREGYGGRLRGFFLPPKSGLWIFYLASDDASELRLNPTGPGAEPSELTLLTAETSCCHPFAAHASAPQALTAGQLYYLEALYKEGTGGDFCQVAAKLSTDPTPPDALTPIEPSNLASLADTVNSTISITRQPSDFLFIQNPRGPSGSNAVFTVASTGSGPLSYQWERDAGAGYVAVAGAHSSVFSFLPVLAENTTKVRVRVFTPGKSATSAPAILTVVQPNTPPKFVCGPAQTVNQDSGAQEVTNWATDISAHSLTGFQNASASAESNQIVNFLVSNDNPALFSQQPAISAEGVLTYTSAPDACGAANVMVVAKDNGGTDYGGADTSEPCSFVITINGVNHAPSAISQTVRILNCQPESILLGATDPDSGACGALPTDATIVTQPMHGTLAQGPTAFGVVYTAAANYFGPDSFTFAVTDGVAVSAPATVTVNVSKCNEAPTARFTVEPLADFRPLVDVDVAITCGDTNACLVFDGRQSTDPESPLAELTLAWYLENAMRPFAFGVLVTNCLELGPETITLTVTDPEGESDSASLPIEVIGVSDAFDLLIDGVTESSVVRRNKRPFIATLKAASAAAMRDHSRHDWQWKHGGISREHHGRTAINQLNAFQNKVRAQVAHEHPGEAALWIRWAQYIIDALARCADRCDREDEAPFR